MGLVPSRKGAPETTKESSAGHPSEQERVICWRMETLLIAGATPSIAEALAERQDVDLHEAADLIEHLRAGGHSILLARKILL